MKDQMQQISKPRLYINVDKFLVDLDNESGGYSSDNARKVQKFIESKGIDHAEIFSMTMSSRKKAARWARAAKAALADYGLKLIPQKFDPTEILASYFKNMYSLSFRPKYFADGSFEAEESLARAASDSSIFKWYVQMVLSRTTGRFYFVSKGIDNHIFYDFCKVIYCLDSEAIEDNMNAIDSFEKKISFL